MSLRISTRGGHGDERCSTPVSVDDSCGDRYEIAQTPTQHSDFFQDAEIMLINGEGKAIRQAGEAHRGVAGGVAVSSLAPETRDENENGRLIEDARQSEIENEGDIGNALCEGDAVEFFLTAPNGAYSGVARDSDSTRKEDQRTFGNRNVSAFKPFILAASSSESSEGYIINSMAASQDKASLIRKLQEQVQTLDFQRKEDNIEKKHMKTDHQRELKTLREELDSCHFAKYELEAKLTETISAMEEAKKKELEKVKHSVANEIRSARLKVEAEMGATYDKKLASIRRENDKRIEGIRRDHEGTTQELKKELEAATLAKERLEQKNEALVEELKKEPEVEDSSQEILDDIRRSHEAEVNELKKNLEDARSADSRGIEKDQIGELQERLDASESHVASLKEELNYTMDALRDMAKNLKQTEDELETYESSKQQMEEDFTIKLEDKNRIIRSLEEKVKSKDDLVIPIVKPEDENTLPSSPPKQQGADDAGGPVHLREKLALAEKRLEEKLALADKTVPTTSLRSQESLQRELSDATSRLAEREKELKRTKQLLVHARETRETKGTEVLSLQQELKDAKSRLADTEAELQSKTESRECEGTGERDELALLQRELSDAKTRLADTEAELNHTAESLESAKGIIAQEREAKLRDKRDLKIAELEETVAELQKLENGSGGGDNDEEAVNEVRERFLEVFHVELKEKDDEIKELQQKVVTHDQAKQDVVAEMQRKLHCRKQEVFLLQENIVKHKESIDALKSKEASLQANLATVDTKLKEANGTIEKLRSDYQTLEDKNKILCKKEQDLKKERDSLITSLEETSKGLEAKLMRSEEAFSNLEQTNAHLVKKQDDLLADIERQNKEVASLEKKNTDLEKLEKSRRFSEEALTAENLSLRDSLDKVKTEIEEVTKQRQKIELELERSRSEYKELEVSTKRLEDSLAGKETTVAEQQKTISSLTFLQHSSEETRKGLEEKLSSRKASISKLEKSNARLSEETNELKSQIQAKDDSISSLEKEIAEQLKKEKSLVSSQDTLKEQNEDLNQVLEEMEQEIEDLRTCEEKLQTELQNARSAKGELEVSVGRLQEAVAKRDKVVSEKQKSLDLIQSERDIAHGNLRDLQDEFEDYKDLTSTEITNIETRLERAKDVIRQYKETTDELDDKVVSLREKVGRLQTDAAMKSSSFCGGIFPV